MAQAIRSKRRKLTPRQVLQIRQLYRQNRRGKGPKLAHIDLAMRFKVSTQTICSILRGRTYADVKPPRKTATAAA